MPEVMKTRPKPGTPQALGKLEHRIIATVREPLLVLDDELCGLVLRLIRGIEVSDDTMALDLIKQVGWQGHYLAQPHAPTAVRTEG